MYFQILFDFSHRFSDSDCDAFLGSWPEYRVRLKEILRNQYQASIRTTWSEDISDLLILLKLNPARANGRNLLTIESFNKAIEKLFVFRKVSKISL